MGRALFSTIYQSEPVVRTVPEPELNDVPAYAKWSYANQFDPDSDEFFMDAEYEAFILPTDVREHLREQDDQQDHGANPSSENSPMAVGEDPASLIPRQPLPWNSERQRFTVVDEIDGQWRIVGNSTEDRRDDASRTLLVRADATANDGNGLRSTAPTDVDSPTPFLPPLSEPIPIPRSRSGSPLGSSGSESASPPPSTPPPQAYSFTSMATPLQSISISPPPTVSPRIYTWNRDRYVGSPGSPAARRGPLTNPSARISFPRLASANLGMRVENIAY